MDDNNDVIVMKIGERGINSRNFTSDAYCI